MILKRKVITNFFLLSLILLVPGCSTLYHHTTKKERKQLEEETYKKTGYSVIWENDTSSKKLSPGQKISRDDAARMAILNEPNLQVKLKELGISKADLVQAGFLSNPRIATLFEFPRNSGLDGLIGIDATLKVSDFWQIPLRKKVAEDRLAIVSTEILNTILETIEGAKKAYNQVIFEEAQLTHNKVILHRLMELRNTIEQQHYNGVTSKFDIYFAEAAVGEWRVRVAEKERTLTNAYLHLRNQIGIDVALEEVQTTDALRTGYAPLNNPLGLVEYAKQNKPTVQISQLKITQSQHEQSLEKSKIIDDVNFGLSFSQGPQGNKYLGPTIGFEMPFFDFNQAKIARARALEAMAKKELTLIFSDIEESVQTLYNNIQSQIEKIELYETAVIPQSNQALDYAHENELESLKLSAVTLIQSEINLYDTELDLNQQYLDLWQNIASLERELGGSIPNFTQN